LERSDRTSDVGPLSRKVGWSMRKTKIVAIGAGSASFGLGTISDAISTPEIWGSTLVLVDTNPDALELMVTVAHRMNDAAGAGLVIEAQTDRTKALSGAEFVIISVAVRRSELWKLDFEIPLKYGFKQIQGENGGPGGLFHSMRNIPILLDIARDIERLAPNAIVLSFTNPVPRICMALTRHTRLRVVGLCHGIGGTIWRLSNVIGVPEEDIDAKAAGLNHFTWILELRRKSTGEDLYPLLREKLSSHDPSFMPLSRKMFEVFGYYPSPGDDHIGEYLPYAYETVGLKGPDFESMALYRDEVSARLRGVADSSVPAQELLGRKSGERAFAIISGVLSNSNHLELAVNIPNRGLISNLPDEAIVEVPALISSRGVDGIQIGPLPTGIAQLCAEQVAVQELVVEAAVSGSRRAALQALLADPIVHSLEAAERCLDEMLRVQAEWLPQFR